jgi:hypothetical protein
MNTPYSGYYHGHSFEDCIMYLDKQESILLMGAVIAARAVITKDVGPYEICG